MSSRFDASRLSRRALLRAAGVAAGAAAGAALLPRRLAAAGAPLTVAVVLPRQTRLVGLGDQLLDGLRLARADANLPLRLLPTWYEGGEAAGLRAIEATAASRGADLIVGAVSHHAAAALGPTLAEQRIPLVVADVGATIARPNQWSPYIFRSSLGHWQSAWALGQWAAGALGPRVLIASACYDSGFDTVHAFWSGFERAGGHRPELIITGLPQGATVSDAVASAVRLRPDAVFGLYNGPRAVEFVRTYAGSALAGRVPLLGSPFMADEALLPALGPTAEGIRSAHSWAPTPGAAPASAFTALGYDTGLLLAVVARAGERGAGLRDALAGASVTGARGLLQMDPQTQELRSPVLLRQVADGANRRIVDLAEFAAAPLVVPAGPRSGWSGAYLMV